MNPTSKYIQELISNGDQLLLDYYSFLEIFYNNISRHELHDHLQDYLQMDRMWQYKIMKNSRVLKQFDNKRLNSYNREHIEKCKEMITYITDSLDRYKSELHDELCSLNKKNTLFGLKYNRYQTNGLNPLYVDIKT